MKTSIDTRELITFSAAGGNNIVGTYHKAQNLGYPSRLENGQESRVGVLFLNAGILSRAATGDTAVYWANALASRGYPSFRFDLPGLGDSNGNLPAKVIDFLSVVSAGDYGRVLSELTKHLVENFNLLGLVVVGHCAGAATALYAAAADKRIKGLILMDPYFYVQREITRRSLLSRWHLRNMRKLETDWERSVPSEPHNLSMGLLLKLRGIQQVLRQILLRARGQRLPSTANLPLIHCWKQVAASGRPILVMSSPWSKPKVGSFDYFSYLLTASDRRARIDAEVIDDTTHNFAEGPGKEAVRRYTEQWLSANFPLAGWKESEAEAHRSVEVPEFSHRDGATSLATV